MRYIVTIWHWERGSAFCVVDTVLEETVRVFRTEHHETIAEARQYCAEMNAENEEDV